MFLSYSTLSIDSELKTNTKNFLLDWIILLVEILMMNCNFHLFPSLNCLFQSISKCILYIELSAQCGNLNKTIFTLMLPDHYRRILKWVLIQLILKSWWFRDFNTFAFITVLICNSVGLNNFDNLFFSIIFRILIMQTRPQLSKCMTSCIANLQALYTEPSFFQTCKLGSCEWFSAYCSTRLDSSLTFRALQSLWILFIVFWEFP